MMVNGVNVTSVYPDVMGTEQETSLSYGRVGPAVDGQTELSGQVPADSLSGALNAYKYFGLHGLKYAGEFDTSGARTYVDGTHLEYSTAECSTLEQLVARTQGVEILLDGVAKHLASRAGPRSRVGINRRVVDSFGNSFGCHDNFGYGYVDDEEMYGGKGQILFGAVRNLLLGHLLTRSFVTGAGYVNHGGYQFAQKMDNIDTISAHSTESSLFRYADWENGTRIEVRCSDANISPWATYMRIGSSAIALAIAQTFLSQRFETFDEDLNAVRSEARRFNHCPIGIDGKIGDWSNIEKQIEFQTKLARTFLSEEMLWYGNRPKELETVAHELLEYCEDMKSVLRGDATYKILGDRADWAAKLEIIERSIQRDRAKDTERHLGDWKSRQDDILYDYIDARLDADRAPVVSKVGAGYQLRDKRNRFRMAIDPRIVETAFLIPPCDTRAALRAHLIKNYQIGICNWNTISVQAPGQGYEAELFLSGPRVTMLSDEQKQYVKEVTGYMAEAA